MDGANIDVRPDISTIAEIARRYHLAFQGTGPYNRKAPGEGPWAWTARRKGGAAPANICQGGEQMFDG
jgi:hypothetical protein